MNKFFVAIICVLAFQGHDRANAELLKKLFLGTSSVADKILPNVIAQRLGFYREEGYDLEIILTRGSVAIQGLLAGSLDYINHTSVTPAVLRGAPLRVILIDSDRPTHYFVTSSTIYSFSDLIGKSIAIDDFAGNAGLLARELIIKKGLPLNQVSLRVIGPPPFRFQALLGGAVDATLLNYNLAKQAQAQGFRSLLYLGDLLSEVGPSLATTQAKLKIAQEEVYRVTKATLKAYLFMYRNSDEALKFFMENQRIDDIAAARDGWQARLRRTSNSSRTGMASEEALNETLQVVKRQLEMTGAALSGRDLRSDAVFDFKLVKQAVKELEAENWDPTKYRYVRKANSR